MVDSICNFSFAHYEDCIKSALNKGYKFLRFRDYKESGNYEKVIFMRHDIDIEVDNAGRMAEIEHKHGISATYFVRVLGVYNPWNIKVFDRIKKILDLGHEIGLHYEPDFSVVYNRNLAEDIEFHIKMLEKLLQTNVTTICPHEPTRTNFSKLGAELRRKFNNLIEAYDDFFLKEMKYISDSSCRWREGCMHEFIDRDVKKLCILTHPFWWYNRSPIENY